MLLNRSSESDHYCTLAHRSDSGHGRSMAAKYWKAVHRRVARETMHALSLESGGRVVIAVLLAAIYLAIIWFVG